MREHKSIGRPKRYDNPEGKAGAPQLTVRLEPLVHAHIHAQKDGPRAYLERLVRRDMGDGKDSCKKHTDLYKSLAPGPVWGL